VLYQIVLEAVARLSIGAKVTYGLDGLDRSGMRDVIRILVRSKSTTVTSRSSSGSHLLRAPDHHGPTKVALGNIVQALVERTFAWLGRCRRLAKDFEATTASAVGWAFVAHTRTLTR
jgi:transposase